jgi:hypothetical protein
MYKKKIVIPLAISLLLININLNGFSQQARWITHPTADLNAHGVFNFRKSFELDTKPESFVIEVSADPRYRLYVNGTPVCFGPAKSGVNNWRYERLDIARYLKAGKNTLAAWVYNRGDDNPVAQPSAKTAFYLKGSSESESSVNTNETWLVTEDKGYRQISSNDMKWWSWTAGWYAMGSTLEMVGKDMNWGWQENDYDDSSWLPATLISEGSAPWKLEPRLIPFLEERLIVIPKIARSNGIEVSGDFPAGEDPLVIPANSTVKILLDQEVLTIGYPEMILSRGTGSEIKVTYAEALFKTSEVKDNRNRIDGMFIGGYWDIIRPDGGQARMYRPLWFRTYRFIQLDITTQSEELIIDSFKTMFTAYPFEKKATLDLGSDLVDTMMNIGWRTARLCAAETYFDCPYYEQLNYGGDTRVQAHISLYLSGDDRLMKDAIRHMFNSTTSEGITRACYPMREQSSIMIPTYSLFTISMMHDYYMHREDSLFLAQYIPNIRSILEWYKGFLNQDNILQDVSHWNFVDWAFDHGTPPGVEGDSPNISTNLTLHYAITLKEAADLMAYFGDPGQAEEYRELASELILASVNTSWVLPDSLFSDTPDKNSFSQHTNLYAVLADAIPVEDQPALMDKILNTKKLVQAKPYFKFYLFKALDKTGMGDQFMDLLEPWEKQIDFGLTTFTEEADLYHDRSDCHAWTAHPLYYFFYTICGIRPDAPAFKEVLISPNPGHFKDVNGSIPHPQGTLSVSLSFSEDLVSGTISLPGEVSGRFQYFGKEVKLVPGENIIEVEYEPSTVNTERSKEQGNLTLYPNPANETIRFLRFESQSQGCRVEIFDITGKKLRESEMSIDNSELNISDLTGGVYIFRISHGGSYVQTELIKKI